MMPRVIQTQSIYDTHIHVCILHMYIYKYILYIHVLYIDTCRVYIQIKYVYIFEYGKTENVL